MGRAHTWMLAAALAQAMRANAARPNAAPSDRKPEEKRMNDQAPPADAPAPTVPTAPEGQPAPDAPAPDTAGQAGAAAPVQPAPPQPAAQQPTAGGGGGGAGGGHDVPAITDYLPVMLAATSGLLKAASAIQKQVDEDQEVPAFYLDMAGNFLGMLGIMAEAYRRNTRRGAVGDHAGGDARAHPGAGADPADAV